MSSGQPNRKRKPRPPAPRKNTKVTGERSEANFLAKAAAREFGIAKPWGDSRRYDFILDNGERLHRIQVKCTESIRMRAYETRATYTTGKGRAVYTKKDIDFIAAHVVPLDIWYIIPVEVCTPAPMLRFYPHRKAKRMRLEPYREAWHLLQSQEQAGHIELQASADETSADGTVDAFVRRPNQSEPSTEAHMGIPAPSCPPSKAQQARCGAGAPARDPQDALKMLRTRVTPVRLPKSAAPWPIPPLRIFVTRNGKQILPDPGTP